jgi:hypothetical protein
VSSSFDFYGGLGSPGVGGLGSPGVGGLGSPGVGGPTGTPGDSATFSAAAVGTPAVDRWGLPTTGGFPVSSVDLSSPFATSAYAPSRRDRRPWYAVIAVVVIAVTGIAFFVLRSPHPVPLPSSLAGMPKLAIPAGQGQALDAAKKSLSHEGLHDVALGIYGASDASGPGLVVIAARASSGAPDFNQLVGAMGTAGTVAGITVTPQTVTSGVTAWRCATIVAQGQSVPFCAWAGSHSVLLGIGHAMSVQDDADALELARLRANLS